MPLLSGKCRSKVRLDGKIAVITGCNTGIGKETVLDFYKRGCKIYMACRNLEKAEEAKRDVMKKCEKLVNLGTLIVIKLDLMSLASVRECAKQILETETKLDLLINNAGVMLCPKGITEDGFETHMGTNHFSHFLFTLLLFPLITKADNARIVNVSSLVHSFGKMDFEDLNFEKRSYSPVAAYNQSKLANILFTKGLVKKIEEHNIKGVNVYCLHPGVIDSDLDRHLDTAMFRGARFMYRTTSLFHKSPESGAQTTIYCAIDEKCANETGLYYSDCVVTKPSKDSRKHENIDTLWKISEKAVGLENWSPVIVQNISSTSQNDEIINQ